MPELVRLIALVGVPRQPHHPVRELEGERIPAFAAPTLSDAPALEDDVLTPELTEVVAHRQPGLASPDAHPLDSFRHRLPWCSRSRSTGGALLRFHPGLARRPAPIDQLLPEKRGQLLGRRALGLDPQPLKLL